MKSIANGLPKEKVDRRKKQRTSLQGAVTGAAAAAGVGDDEISGSGVCRGEEQVKAVVRVVVSAGAKSR